ncbi:MAG: ABC transporter ATP-binding protein, partial [Myxococcota bacterium]|nr:ABC transporter ATP-binding protein [Myxococcota bacterium]
MTNSDLIAVQGLEIRRGEFSLRIPEWRVAPGQVIGLVGPNGAGKTTLLEALAGMRATDGGRVGVLGHDPWVHPEIVRSQLGFMTDDMPLFSMRIGPLLRMISGYYPSWDATLAGELLERFGLDPRTKVAQLSKGQGTRIRLVLAMAFRPRVLVLDEPATGLDLAGRRSLLRSVLDVVRDPQRTVIVSSHQLQDVERIDDRLLVLDAGQVIQQGPPRTWWAMTAPWKR